MLLLSLGGSETGQKKFISKDVPLPVANLSEPEKREPPLSTAALSPCLQPLQGQVLLGIFRNPDVLRHPGPLAPGLSCNPHTHGTKACGQARGKVRKPGVTLLRRGWFSGRRGWVRDSTRAWRKLLRKPQEVRRLLLCSFPGREGRAGPLVLPTEVTAPAGSQMLLFLPVTKVFWDLCAKGCGKPGPLVVGRGKSRAEW